MIKITKAKLKKLERRQTKRYFREWAALVKERDNRQCVICQKKERLNAHHIIPREIKELRFDINNGISLCPKHHQFNREISAHGNSFAFIEWFRNNRHKQYKYLKNRIL